MMPLKLKKPFHVIMQENSFIVSFIFTGISLLIILLTLPVRYETNDDFTMLTILSGNGGFPSSPDAIFLNPILGYVLYFLYKLVPSFPWYGAFLYTVYYLGWTLIFSAILRANKGFCFLLAMPLLVCLFFYHSSFVNFTSASLLLTFGVYLCTVEYFIRNEAPMKNIRIYFIFLAICFYLSFLLRWKLILDSLFLFLPMVVFMKIGQAKKVFPVLIMLGVVICFNAGFNYFTSNQPYNEFNELREDFHDTSMGDIHGQITPYAAEKAGWTYEDYVAFRDLWLIYDNYTFSTSKLSTFLIENNPRKDSGIHLNYIIKKIKENYDNNNSKNLFILLLVSLLSIFIFRSTYLLRLEKIDWLRITISLGTIIMSILFFMYYRFQLRVYGPLYIYLLSMWFLLFNTLNNSEHKVARNKLLRYFTIIIAGAFMAYALLIVRQDIIYCYDILGQSLKNKVLIYQELNLIENINQASHPVFIQMFPLANTGLFTEIAHPLKEYKDFPHIRVFPCGWVINSTYYDMALKDLHLRDGHDFLKWLVDRKDVFLVLTVRDIKEMNAVLFLWKYYYLRHITPGMKLEFTPVYDFRNREGNGQIFFQIRSEHLQ